MNDLLLTLYHRAPYPAKVLAASLRGALLNSTRYGPTTDRLVEETLERERWSREQWRGWQQERLGRILHRAAARVPYYQRAWTGRQAKLAGESWIALENWPVLHREQVRRDPTAFVADDRRRGGMIEEHTSGTSGTPLSLWCSRPTARQWYALFEARCRRWNGVDRSRRWALLGGQLIVEHARRRPPFWVWNAAGRQLYMSVYHMAPDLLPAYLQALRLHRVEYLLGYSSALHSLARAAIRHPALRIPMQVVITNAEPLWPHQRAAVEEAFQCRVVETYGMAEMAAGASECAEGRLHFWPEAGILEVLRDNVDDRANAAGRLVCTGLLNEDMPLVRYETGDRGRDLVWDHGCGCGRTLPVLPGIEGRIDDVVVTRDGRDIGRLDPVFKGGLPVKEAQIVQESLDCIRLKVVPDDGFGPSAADELTRRVRARVGNVHVTIEEVSELPRTLAGKLKAVVSLVKQNGRQ